MDGSDMSKSSRVDILYDHKLLLVDVRVSDCQLDPQGRVQVGPHIVACLGPPVCFSVCLFVCLSVCLFSLSRLCLYLTLLV